MRDHYIEDLPGGSCVTRECRETKFEKHFEKLVDARDFLVENGIRIAGQPTETDEIPDELSPSLAMVQIPTSLEGQTRLEIEAAIGIAQIIDRFTRDERSRINSLVEPMLASSDEVKRRTSK